jgi:hypothetical protein
MTNVQNVKEKENNLYLRSNKIRKIITRTHKLPGYAISLSQFLRFPLPILLSHRIPDNQSLNISYIFDLKPFASILSHFQHLSNILYPFNMKVS